MTILVVNVYVLMRIGFFNAIQIHTHCIPVAETHNEQQTNGKITYIIVNRYPITVRVLYIAAYTIYSRSWFRVRATYHGVMRLCGGGKTK